MPFKELSHTAEQASTPAGIKGHDHLGPNGQANPYRFPLLHKPPMVDFPALSLGEVNAPPLRDDLAPVRGIIFCLAWCVPLWAGIVGVVWAVLR